MSSIPCIGGPLDGTGVDRDVTRFGVDMGDGSDSYGYTRTEFQGMQFLVLDTMGFLAARREMRRLYAATQNYYRDPDFMEMARRQVEQCVRDAEAMYGAVITVTQRPLQPLGMAHYETVVEVRPVQVPK